MTARLLAPVGRVWTLATAITLLAALALGTLVAPPDAVQGEAQRLMYVHVPAAWSAYLCFGIVLLASLVQLRTRARVAAVVGRSAAEVGVALTALTLLSGSVWGALVWGTWWVWDARVTTTVAMGLVYVTYLAVRALEGGPRSRTATAVLGVAGFAAVPLVHFSVVWWRTVHQPATILSPELAMPIDPLMALALMVSVLAATLLAVAVLRTRVRALLAQPMPQAPMDGAVPPVVSEPARTVPS